LVLAAEATKGKKSNEKGINFVYNSEKIVLQTAKFLLGNIEFKID
jgi:hypothetical protein